MDKILEVKEGMGRGWGGGVGFNLYCDVLNTDNPLSAFTWA